MTKLTQKYDLHHLIGLCVVRRFLGLAYLNISFIFPLVGAVQLVKQFPFKRLRIEILLLLFLAILSFIRLLFFYSGTSLVRSIQFTFIIFGFDYICLKFSEADYVKTSKLIVSLVAVGALIELMCGESQEVTKLIGIGSFVVRRMHGVAGEANYTTLVVLGVFSLFFYKKMWKFSILCIPLWLSTFSRMFLIGFAVLVILYFLEKKYKNLARLFSRVLLVICFLLPFIYFSIDRYARLNIGDELFQSLSYNLEVFTSGRSIIASKYIEILLDNPFGVGYFNTPFLQEQFKSGLFKNKNFFQEHSLYLQIMVSLGFLGGGILFAFFWKVINIASKNRKLVLLGPMIVSMAFVNGSHDFIIYMIFAYSIKEVSLES